MYANLKGELSKRNITARKASAEIGMNENTFRYKLVGNGKFAIDEAFAIKTTFFSLDETPLEILFQKSDRRPRRNSK